jgi:hypothetical protein
MFLSIANTCFARKTERKNQTTEDFAGQVCADD